MLYSIKKRGIIYLIFDVVLVGISYMVADIIALYFVSRIYTSISFIFMAFLVLLYILGLYLFQCYRIIWRYSTIRDFYQLLYGCILGFVLSGLFAYFFSIPVDRLWIFLAFIFTVASTGGYRVLIRDMTVRKRSFAKALVAPRRILIAGAGEAGRTIMSELSRQGAGLSIIGFVDDDADKVGTLLCGKPVVGTTSELPVLINQYDIGEVIIAMPSAPVWVPRRIIGLVQKVQPRAKISILPSIMRSFEKALTPELREIGVNELIGREEVPIYLDDIAVHFEGKTVLVTGAGGSIGSELCRQLLKFKVKSIIAVGRGEHSMYMLKQTLHEYRQYFEDAGEVSYYIADVTDYARMKTIMDKEKPQVVFHAAAHKYVDIMEDNPTEAYRNNVIGTHITLKVSLECGVDQFVCISTDKAVKPVSVMGATKRVAELVTLHYSHKGLNASSVRFGNVIGSRGSVIPLFYRQVEKGGPVTITHPDMKRYFMSIPEAVLLVINAAAYAKGGEIFVLDMGTQYRIEDVAKNLIRLLGYEPGIDIPIVYTGLRPGEKMYEELWYSNETLIPTANENIHVLAQNSMLIKDAVHTIMELDADTVQRMTSQEMKELLMTIIPEYTSFEN